MPEKYVYYISRGEWLGQRIFGVFIIVLTINIILVWSFLNPQQKFYQPNYSTEIVKPLQDNDQEALEVPQVGEEYSDVIAIEP